MGLRDRVEAGTGMKKRGKEQREGRMRKGKDLYLEKKETSVHMISSEVRCLLTMASCSSTPYNSILVALLR